MASHFYFRSGMGQVDKPTIAYKGQKLRMLVRVKTAANTKKIMPRVPVTVLVK